MIPCLNDTHIEGESFTEACGSLTGMTVRIDPNSSSIACDIYLALDILGSRFLYIFHQKLESKLRTINLVHRIWLKKLHYHKHSQHHPNMKSALAYRNCVRKKAEPSRTADVESGWVLVDDGDKTEDLDSDCIIYSTTRDLHELPASGSPKNAVPEDESLSDYEIVSRTEAEGSTCPQYDSEQGENDSTCWKDEAVLGLSYDDTDFPPVDIDPFPAIEADDSGTQEHDEALDDEEDLANLGTLDPITRFLILADIMERETRNSGSIMFANACHLKDSAGNSYHQS